MSEFLNPAPRFFDAEGKVLDGGTVTFLTTNTLTLKDIFSDINLTVIAANPVKLGSGGEMPFRFLNGSYRIRIESKTGVLIDDLDPIAGNPALFGAFGTWNTAVVYSIDNSVQGSDGEYYKSLTNNNVANDPTTPSPGFWVKLIFIEEWNTNISYSIGFCVKASNNELYRSLSNLNSGNDPTLDTTRTNWVNLGMTSVANAAAKTFAFNNF